MTKVLAEHALRDIEMALGPRVYHPLLAFERFDLRPCAELLLQARLDLVIEREIRSVAVAQLHEVQVTIERLGADLREARRELAAHREFRSVALVQLHQALVTIAGLRARGPR